MILSRRYGDLYERHVCENTTGVPTSKYKHLRTSALFRNFPNVRFEWKKKTYHFRKLFTLQPITRPYIGPCTTQMRRNRHFLKGKLFFLEILSFSLVQYTETISFFPIQRFPSISHVTHHSRCSPILIFTASAASQNTNYFSH